MTIDQAQKQANGGLTAAFGLAAVWILAAAFRPDSTFHLAPILIAGIVPLVRNHGIRRHGKASALGFAIAIIASLALAILDLLRGPTLLPFGDAFVEAVVFALATALATYALTRFMPTAHGDAT
jgi:hypothetical protein